jgi:hypothetical protein
MREYVKWSVRKRIARPPHYLRWSLEAKQRLQAMTKAGSSSRECAAVFGCSEVAINSARCAFGFSHMKSDFEQRVAQWMERYGVGRVAVMSLGLERLEIMGEEARAFLLRDIDRGGVKTGGGRPRQETSWRKLIKRRPAKAKPSKDQVRDARMAELSAHIEKLKRWESLHKSEAA